MGKNSASRHAKRRKKMSDVLVASNSDMDRYSLCAYWEYYHFVPLEEFDLVHPKVKNMSEADIVTGLTVFEGKAKTVMVEGTKETAPLLVVVDDLGVFRSIYDKTEEMTIRASSESRKAKQISFTREKF